MPGRLIENGECSVTHSVIPDVVREEDGSDDGEEEEAQDGQEEGGKGWKMTLEGIEEEEES